MIKLECQKKQVFDEYNIFALVYYITHDSDYQRSVFWDVMQGVKHKAHGSVFVVKELFPFSFIKL